MKTSILDLRNEAMLAFERVPVDAVIHLKEALERDRVDGKDFCRCFYGTLAAGSGVDIRTGDQFERFDRIKAFWLERGVVLIHGRFHNPLERFAERIGLGNIPPVRERAEVLVRWCNEFLEEEKLANRRDSLMVAGADC